MGEERLVLRNISKTFNIGFKKKKSFLSAIINFIFKKEARKKIKVLDKLSLKVGSGEIIGIVGDNGSGKSTLLRIIAGIYKNYEGEVFSKGKIISLINLIVGLKDRLTMRDNIFLCCALFGLSKKEIKKKFDNIVEFSELKEFLDTKIYQFSEGMKQRLAFSIAINCNPDILLLDEVFEVGDSDFRKRSSTRIKEVTEKGGCVLLVSHDMELVNKYCSKVIWMRGGTIFDEGTPDEIIQKYRDKKIKQQT